MALWCLHTHRPLRPLCINASICSMMPASAASRLIHRCLWCIRNPRVHRRLVQTVRLRIRRTNLVSRPPQRILRHAVQVRIQDRRRSPLLGIPRHIIRTVVFPPLHLRHLWDQIQRQARRGKAPSRRLTRCGRFSLPCRPPTHPQVVAPQLQRLL